MNTETSTAVEDAAIDVGHDGHEPLQWRVHAHVDKYTQEQAEIVAEFLRKAAELVTGDDFQRLGIDPVEQVDVDHNLLTTAGLNRLTALLIGAGGQAATNTATRLGVGNATTAEAVAQTDLQAAAGAANRYFMPMDATYPTQANGVVTARATFATADGNFVWNEWGLDIGAPTVTAGAVVNAVLLNRKVASLGTKASGSWVLTVTITIS